MAGDPFFEPTYFAGTYFAGLSGSPSTPSGSGPAPGTPPAAIPGDCSDSSCLAWIKAVLLGLEDLETVRAGRLALKFSAEDFPAAVVYPVRFEELDQVDPVDRVRVWHYGVRLTVRPEDQDDDVGVFELLDGLGNLAANAIADDPVPGSIAALSSISSGSYPEGGHDGTLSVVLDGSVAYLIPGVDGRVSSLDD